MNSDRLLGMLRLLDLSDQQPSRAHASNLSLHNPTAHVASSHERAMIVDYSNPTIITRQAICLTFAPNKRSKCIYH